MKLVKMNSRWRQWQQGHRVALRFNSWNKQAQHLEQVCKKRLGSSGYWRHGDWYAWFGKSRDGLVRPYFISFRNEQDAAFILLSADLTK